MEEIRSTVPAGPGGRRAAGRGGRAPRLTAVVAAAGMLLGLLAAAPASARDKGAGATEAAITIEGGAAVTLDQVADAVEKATGQRLESERVLVTTDNGAPLTDEQFEALSAGKEVDGVKLLAAVEKPSGRTTIGELEKAAGDDSVAKRISYGSARIRVDIVIICWGRWCWIIVVIRW